MILVRHILISRSTGSQVVNFTYIQMNSGWVYTAFIIDLFSRAIVHWKVSKKINMVMDSLEQALHSHGMYEDMLRFVSISFFTQTIPRFKLMKCCFKQDSG